MSRLMQKYNKLSISYNMNFLIIYISSVILICKLQFKQYCNTNLLVVTQFEGNFFYQYWLSIFFAIMCDGSRLVVVINIVRSLLAIQCIRINWYRKSIYLLIHTNNSHWKVSRCWYEKWSSS